MTRDEYKIIWGAIKRIEKTNLQLYTGSIDWTRPVYRELVEDINLIKEFIQKEIGQLE